MNKLYVTSLLALLASCSSHPIRPEMAVADGESDYVVKERNPELTP